MNRIILMGYLANDPEYFALESGVSRCVFRIAVQRRFANAKGEREADFFQCVAWRNTADFISHFFAKGSRIAIEGSLQTRSYSAQDGAKRYVTEVIAENAEFCESRNTGGAPQERPAQQPAEGQPDRQMNMREMGGFTEIEDDELPF